MIATILLSLLRSMRQIRQFGESDTSIRRKKRVIRRFDIGISEWSEPREIGFASALRENMKPLADDAHGAPVRQHLCSHLLVEADGGCIPLEHVPLQTRAALAYRDGGYAGEQSFANSLSAVFRTNVKVFDMNTSVAAPSGVVMKVKRKAHRSGRVGFAQFCDEAVEAFCGAKAVAEKIGLGGVDRVGFPFILGELADEGEHLWNVGGRRGTEVECMGLVR